jgi:hypothetical protein
VEGHRQEWTVKRLVFRVAVLHLLDRRFILAGMGSRSALGRTKR